MADWKSAVRQGRLEVGDTKKRLGFPGAFFARKFPKVGND